jgi:hypothetical protein
MTCTGIPALSAAVMFVCRSSCRLTRGRPASSWAWWRRLRNARGWIGTPSNWVATYGDGHAPRMSADASCASLRCARESTVAASRRIPSVPGFWLRGGVDHSGPGDHSGVIDCEARAHTLSDRIRGERRVRTARGTQRLRRSPVRSHDYGAIRGNWCSSGAVHTSKS